MSVPVQFTLANFPNNYCFTNPQQYATDLVALLSGIVNVSGKVIVSDAAPGPSDRDAVWVRTIGGYFDKVFIYLGGWYSPNPTPASSNAREIWAGSEASVWSYDGGDGTDPGSVAPTPTSGAMWQVDHNFDFRFPFGAGTNGTVYDGQPATVVAQGGTGGAEKVAILNKEMPNHTHTVPIYQGDTTNFADRIPCTDETAPENLNYQTGATGGDSGDHHTWSHQNLPPYVGIFFIRRTIRAFYVAT